MKLEVFDPCGLTTDTRRHRHAPRLTGLHGKTIGEISNRLWGADRIFPVIREGLRKRFPDLKFIPYTELPSGSDKLADNEKLGEAVLAKGCDAVIGASAG